MMERSNFWRPTQCGSRSTVKLEINIYRFSPCTVYPTTRPTMHGRIKGPVNNMCWILLDNIAVNCLFLNPVMTKSRLGPLPEGNYGIYGTSRPLGASCQHVSRLSSYQLGVTPCTAESNLDNIVVNCFVLNHDMM